MPIAAKRKPGRPAPPHPAPVDPLPPAPVAEVQVYAEGLANIAEAARFLGGVHVATVRNLIRRKELPARHVARRVMIPWAALRAYVAGENC
jgi:excisionase family DNA binding protein